MFTVQEYNVVRTACFFPSFCKCVMYRVIQNDCWGHTQCIPGATPCDFFLWGQVKDQVNC